MENGPSTIYIYIYIYIVCIYIYIYIYIYMYLSPGDVPGHPGRREEGARQTAGGEGLPGAT